MAGATMGLLVGGLLGLVLIAALILFLLFRKKSESQLPHDSNMELDEDFDGPEMENTCTEDGDFYASQYGLSNHDLDEDLDTVPASDDQVGGQPEDDSLDDALGSGGDFASG